MSALSRWERGAYALSALLGLLALVLLPLVRALDPRLAIELNRHGGAHISPHDLLPIPGPDTKEIDEWCFDADGRAPLDPWGHPWRVVRGRAWDLRSPVAYSIGPDGIDSSGEGDDLRLDQDSHPLLRYAERAGEPRAAKPPSCEPVEPGDARQPRPQLTVSPWPRRPARGAPPSMRAGSPATTTRSDPAR